MPHPLRAAGLLLAILCLPPTAAAAESPGDSAVVASAPEPPDYLAPFLEVAGLDVGLWGYNRYVKDYGFARVSPSTMASNLSGGWEWDADQFSINQFGHPYQGSFYHATARSHGHGFYAAAGYTMLGSLQWEYLWENEKPSYNDLLTTTLGGAMVGEVSHRLSHAVRDPDATGAEWLVREVLALGINPMGGAHRLLGGRASTDGLPGKEALRWRVLTGGMIPYFSTAEGEDPAHSTRVPKSNTEVLVLYGDPYETRRPYDHFIVNSGFGFQEHSAATLYARAQLHRFPLYDVDGWRGMIVLGQSFDYLNNGVYKLGVSGLGTGYAHFRRWPSGLYHTLHFELGMIPLGGVSTEFFRLQSRDYNLGGGAYTTSRVFLGKARNWHVLLVGDRYWIRTRSGAKGDELIGYSQIEFAKSVYGNIGVALHLASYDRSARYRVHGTRSELTEEARLMLTYGWL